MAKTNAKDNKKVVEQPETDVQPGQGTGDAETTQATQAEPEGGEKELQVLQETGGGEKTDGEGGAKMDTGSLQEENGETGGDPSNQGGADNEETSGGESDDEETFREAAEAITGMVSEALESSGILDEPAEVTEKRNRIAKDVFAKNPQCKELFFTADLIPFFVKSDAYRHGTITLKNGVVVTINRK